jgi:hypothetical protein
MDDWEALAACKAVDTDLFFDEDPNQGTRKALAVCHTCPVWEHCLLSNLHEQIGVWGCSARCRSRVRRLARRGGRREQLLTLARSSNEQALGPLAAQLVPQGGLVDAAPRAVAR